MFAMSFKLKKSLQHELFLVNEKCSLLFAVIMNYTQETSKSLVGRTTVDLIRSRGRGFDSYRGQKNFFFTPCGSLIPFTRASGSFMGFT